MLGNVTVIAEVKTRSPFGFEASRSWDDLFALANEFGDIISVHTDPRWGGSLELIRTAKRLTNKPVLAKGIHATDEEVQAAFDAGADYALVVGRIPAIMAERCLIESNTLEELRALPPTLRAVWNSRDLATGGLKKETFSEARAAFGGWLCQASNIATVADIASGADAVLVGTRLPEFTESLPR